MNGAWKEKAFKLYEEVLAETRRDEVKNLALEAEWKRMSCTICVNCNKQKGGKWTHLHKWEKDFTANSKNNTAEDTACM